MRVCPWCNGYRRRNWTRRHEFKSWTRLIAFHIALIPLGKVWIQLLSLQLWVNKFFSLCEATSLGEGKLWIQTCETPLKNWPCVISCPSGGVGKYDKYESVPCVSLILTGDANLLHSTPEAISVLLFVSLETRYMMKAGESTSRNIGFFCGD